MLYIWPFFAFFSAPLLLPYALSVVRSARRIATGSSSKPSVNDGALRAKGSKKGQESKLDSRPLPSEVFFALRLTGKSRTLASTMTILSIIVLSGLVVRYNTIVHPFTLADNRHYMFYVFRYTIRRAAWIRYLLLVPYFISGWMVLGTSAGCSHGPGGDQEATNARQDPAELLQADPLFCSTEAMPTSTGLLLLITTLLSLITAPLVEPRYFIIPWVMWRLQVPAWRTGAPSGGPFSGQSALGRVVGYLGQHDARLLLETAWFLAINLATCYIFLAKPYVWRAEDGTVLDDGRLQRFMW